MYHHRAASDIANFILNKWKNNEWLNDFISNEIELVGSPNDFPSPDAHFQDRSKKTKASIEFKPHYESKRGMMTGLGQTIGYLNKAHISILTTPKIIKDTTEEFDMAEFLKNLFKKYIFGKLPIALISYEIDKSENLKNIKLEVNVDNKLFPLMKDTITFRGSDKPFWAFWRDLPPDGFYKYALTANQTENRLNRSKVVWNNFFYNFYVTNDALKTLDEVDSKIFFWDGKKKMIGAKGTKKFYRKIIDNEKLTENEKIKKNKILKENNIKQITSDILIKELNKRFSSDITDNLYKDNKKNWTIFMDQTELFNGNFQLTSLGRRFMERVELDQSNNKYVNDEFAQIFLVSGKHEIIIKKIIEMSKSIKFKNENDYLDKLYANLDDMGFIAKNEPRSTTGVRKFFTAEKQLWHHHGIQNKNGTRYFFPNEGFSFNLDIIENLVDMFYKNYGDVYRSVISNDIIKN